RAIIALGNVDSWWSPFRTLPPPGEMYILVRGDPDGPFDSVLESVVDHVYDEGTHLFRLDTTPPQETYLRSLGATWVGLWRYFLWREVRYDKWEKKPDPSTDWGLVPKVRGVRGKKGDGPSIFFRYNMATEIKAAETVGNFPVDGVVVFTAQVMNPVKAFFFAGGWEVQTTAAVQGKFRKYVSDKTIDQLREEHKSGGLTLVDEIKALGGRSAVAGVPDDPTGLFDLFGIEVVDARFVLFDLITGTRDEEMIRATRAEQIAILNAKAAAERGKGERQERENRAAGVRAEVEAWGSNPVGGTVAMAEAIKEAKPNVLGGNVMVGVEADRKVTLK
ncbi:MAG: hypothetical protein Q8P21_02500, partial [bacterium]|nr:hypothetical protein [bacterium]